MVVADCAPFVRLSAIRLSVALTLGVASLTSAGCGALIGLDPGGLDEGDAGPAPAAAAHEGSNETPSPDGGATPTQAAIASDPTEDTGVPDVAPLPSTAATAPAPMPAMADAEPAPVPESGPPSQGMHDGMGAADASSTCTKKGNGSSGPGEGSGCGS
jgi:hypothetical protein